ncbi:hypothetical protein BD626DRAFT_547755 [Schizophyllum amplum]|uniref:Uncharacterized protein n=1 Tax=Schizophyllum amplum TaxID=97359 RepID=A0A550CGT4_9AGAR|nr:hypothetical protein BD626DRAFT_547755 [Auriculariopsis ampla]
MPSPTESPWPTQTPGPDAGPSTTATQRKRRRTSDRSLWQERDAILPRQDIADQAAIQDAMYECQVMTDNARLSCYPTADADIPQHQYASFVWNSRLPQYAQRDLVDIYLFQGDTLDQILYFSDVINPQFEAGVIRAQVNDSWWGDRGSNWDGSNISYPFYWVVTPAGNGLDGTETTQTIFSAIQTTYADSIASSMSSSSSAASASSASVSSASLTSNSASATATSGGDGDGDPGDGSNGGLQSGNGDGGFPHWAIAVIVVLGFLAVAASCVLAFLIIRRMRRQRELESQRNSMGSSSPMMRHIDNGPASPLLAAGVAGGEGQPSSAGHGGQNAPSIVSPDGASTISRANSASEGAPFSGADAAIMADAFRKALRKPDFADQPVEEGESPENREPREEELINQQLAEEGRDIRSVSSSRGVRVETLSDADTATDHQH